LPLLLVPKSFFLSGHRSFSESRAGFFRLIFTPPFPCLKISPPFFSLPVCCCYSFGFVDCLFRSFEYPTIFFLGCFAPPRSFSFSLNSVRFQMSFLFGVAMVAAGLSFFSKFFFAYEGFPPVRFHA